MLVDNDIYLVQKLATGGMAEVWEARLHGTGGFDKRLAIKRLLPHLEENDEFVQLFLHEGQLAARLNHPNICQIFQCGQSHGRHYIAMEFIDGFNLDTLLRKAVDRGVYLPLIYVCHMIMSVCSALDYAHALADEQGRPLRLVHRDLSPSNIMLSWDGHIKVVDFGIAKANTQLHETPAGVIRGKFGYLSPEYVYDGPIDARSDLFTLGIVFWEMLAGKRLFPGENEWARMSKIASGKYPRPSSFRADLPDGIEEIAMRALEANIEERYPTCGHMREDIRSLLRRYQAESTPQQLIQYLEALFSDKPLPQPSYDLTQHHPTTSPLTSPMAANTPGTSVTLAWDNALTVASAMISPGSALAPTPSPASTSGSSTRLRPIPSSPSVELVLPLANKHVLVFSNGQTESDPGLANLIDQGAHLRIMQLEQAALEAVVSHQVDVCIVVPGNHLDHARSLLQALQQLRPSLPCLIWGPLLREAPTWKAQGAMAVVPLDASHAHQLAQLQAALHYQPKDEALSQMLQLQFPSTLALIYQDLSQGTQGIEHVHQQLALLYEGLCRWLHALICAMYVQDGAFHSRINARLLQQWLQPAHPHEVLALAAWIVFRYRQEGKPLMLNGLNRWFAPSTEIEASRNAQAQALQQALAPLGYAKEMTPDSHLPALFSHLAWYHSRHWRHNQPTSHPQLQQITEEITPLLLQICHQLLAQLHPLIDYSIVRVDEIRQSENNTNINHSLTVYRGTTPKHHPFLSPTPLHAGHSYIFASYKHKPLLGLYPMLTVGRCPTCHHDGFAFPVRLASQEVPLYRGLLCRHLQREPGPVNPKAHAYLAALRR